MKEINVVIESAKEKNIEITPTIDLRPIEIGMTIPGPRGKDGSSITILEEGEGLPALSNRGDAYLSGNTLFVYDGESFISIAGGDGEGGGTILPGTNGKSIEYNWDGTKLGIKIEGDPLFEYVDLKGLQGERGLDGLPGKNGEQGIQGIPGRDGEKGEPGPQGEPGVDGIDGYTPIKGIDYFDGEKGETGPPGKDGKQGPQGIPGEDASLPIEILTQAEYDLIAPDPTIIYFIKEE